MRASFITLALIGLASPALAGPCDDGAEAWTTLDRAFDARDRATGLRVASPLLDARCHPTGPQHEIIEEAQLEAQLLQLESHAADLRADVHAPVPAAEVLRDEASHQRWVRTVIAPWVHQLDARFARLRVESDALARVVSAPGIAVDAITAVAATYQSFIDELGRLPLPPSVSHDRRMRDAFVEAMSGLTAPWRDAVRARYREVADYAARRHPSPRSVRRAEAWLALHGETVASASPEEGSPASSVPAAPAQGLAPGQIRAVVLTHLESIRACHERGLELNPTLEGDVRMRFVIGSDGRVIDARTVTPGGPLGSVGTCIAQEMPSWTFPPPASGGIVTVNYPFQLRLDHSTSASPVPSPAP